MMTMQQKQLVRSSLGLWLIAATLLAMLALSGCKNPFGAVITLTKVVENGRAEYDKVFQAGLVPPGVEANAQLAWSSYQRACTVAADALAAYNAGGDRAAYERAFSAVRVAVLAFVDAITPVIAVPKSATLKHEAMAAYKL